MWKKSLSFGGLMLLCTILSRQAISGEGIRPKGVRPDFVAFYSAGRDFQVITTHYNLSFCKIKYVLFQVFA